LSASKRIDRSRSTRACNLSISKLAVESAPVFALALVTAALVALLWKSVGHVKATIDWETAFVLAILFGVVQTWAKFREIKQ
jgi:hypothetical protein